MKEVKESPTSVRKKAKAPAVFDTAVDGGKLPPQAVDLEEAVLGAMMLESHSVNAAIDILSIASFYRDAHQRIFGAIHDLFNRSEPIDILTVTAELKKRGELDMVGGPYYISQLTNRVASAANVEFHARIIAQKYIFRELIRISSDTIRDAYDETQDVFDLLDRTEGQLYDVTKGNIRKSYESMSDLMHKALEHIDTVKNSDEGMSGVPTGFDELDKITSGFQRADMIVIAARPGMGKTAFVLSIARNIAVDFNRPVAVFSLEMSSEQLVMRLIASESEIPSDKLRRGDLEEHEYQQIHSRIKKLSAAPLFIDDTPALTIFELRAKCRRLKAQYNVELIIIDYLQLMSAGTDKGNREQEISTISRSVKSIAKELDVPIIALSQLSRAVESRGGDKRPILSDLRESGAIEQDADIVSFIYRPEYYGVEEDDSGPTNGIGEIIIAKHRNGALANVRLRFIPHLAKFANLDTFNFIGDVSDDDEDMVPTITRMSKMNDGSNDADKSSNEDPFF